MYCSTFSYSLLVTLSSEGFFKVDNIQSAMWNACEILGHLEEIIWCVDRNLARSSQALVHYWKIAGEVYRWYLIYRGNKSCSVVISKTVHRWVYRGNRTDLSLFPDKNFLLWEPRKNKEFFFSPCKSATGGGQHKNIWRYLLLCTVEFEQEVHGRWYLFSFSCSANSGLINTKWRMSEDNPTKIMAK